MTKIQTENRSLSHNILSYNIALTSDVIKQFNIEVEKVISTFIKEKDLDNLKILVAKLIVIINEPFCEINKDDKEYKLIESNINK